MKILENIKVPTGNILIVQGSKGKIEMLSLADYGKDINLTKKSVSHTKLMPLTEKWVITISTQYGCSMNCNFCDVPKVGAGKNASFYDLTGQILTGLKLHPEIKRTKRLNIHFARMGEPTWNPAILDTAKWLHTHILPEHEVVHPVVSTIMPNKNIWLKLFIHTWMRIKNRLYDGNAGLQLSINSTSEKERAIMFNGNALTLGEIAKLMEGIIPVGRKITLNFAVANYQINPDVLLRYFNPELYIIKLTPMHKTIEAENNNIKTFGDYTEYYPYEGYDEILTKAGYDVLVFIASKEEDESRITCGNAILLGEEK
jgi:23S rRNA (adenine2503-C2)-methyltransferase